MKGFVVEFVWRAFARVRVKFFRWLDLHCWITELVSGDIEVKKLIVGLNAIEPVADIVDDRADEGATQCFPDNGRSGGTMTGARHVASQAVPCRIRRKTLLKSRAKLQQLCS